MKKLLIAIAATVSLIGCTPNDGGNTTPSTVTDVSVTGIASFNAAVNAYTAAATVAEAAVRHGNLPPATLQRIRAINHLAQRVITGGDVALSYTQKADVLLSLRRQLLAVVGS